LTLRCKVCGGEFTVDDLVDDQDEEIEEAVANIPADRV
jgi:hypothetical protein